MDLLQSFGIIRCICGEDNSVGTVAFRRIYRSTFIGFTAGYHFRIAIGYGDRKVDRISFCIK